MNETDITTKLDVHEQTKNILFPWSDYSFSYSNDAEVNSRDKQYTEFTKQLGVSSVNGSNLPLTCSQILL